MYEYKITTNSSEISIVLDACSELMDKIRNRASFEKNSLRAFIAKIRDNSEIGKDLRDYAKEILEGEK